MGQPASARPPEIGLELAYASCTSVDAYCGQAIGMDLTATAAGESIRIGPGTESRVRPFVVVNGHSHHRFGITCSDTSEVTVAGYVLRDAP